MRQNFKLHIYAKKDTPNVAGNLGSISNVGGEYKFYDIYSKKFTLGQLLRIVKINPS